MILWKNIENYRFNTYALFPLFPGVNLALLLNGDVPVLLISYRFDGKIFNLRTLANQWRCINDANGIKSASNSKLTNKHAAPYLET